MLPTDVPEDPPGLGNPGWHVSIPISFTGHPTDPFEPIKVERDEHDWIHVWVADGRFEFACGPTNLSEGLFTFRE